MRVGGWPSRWEDEACLGGKEGLDSRWPGHDALTKIERVEASGTRVGPFFRNSDPKKIVSSSVFSAWLLGAHKPIDVLSNISFVEQLCSLYAAVKSSGKREWPRHRHLGER